MDGGLMSDSNDDYYKEQLDEGNKYAEFMYSDYEKRYGWKIKPHLTKEEQYINGENDFGIEIKYDKELINTGNLWIEIAEKTKPTNLSYVPSGILEKHYKLYGIGNYNVHLIFSRSTITNLYTSGRYEIFENNRKTSRGFLLPLKDAKLHANYIIDFKNIDLSKWGMN